ncbi:hypothetical protein MMC17_007345 [Xylographa soralifera]|nr:hypothetical protein [Xylographa soralifera]
MLTAQNNLALSACVRPEAETTTKASSKHREAFNVDKRRFALPVKRARHQHDVGASEHEDYNNGNCTSVKPLPRDELEISRRRRPSIAWEVQPTWRLPRERSSERFFIIETDSALEGSPALRQMSVEQGLEVVPEPVRTLIWKQISRVATFLLRIGLQLWGTGISRKRLRVAAVVISAVAAPTCVSVMSSAGTNSLVITGAVTAIIAAGKFLFDALAG